MESSIWICDALSVRSLDAEIPDDNDNFEQMRAQRRREATAAQFDWQRPAQSLPVPPLPQTQLRVEKYFIVVQDPTTTQVDKALKMGSHIQKEP